MLAADIGQLLQMVFFCQEQTETLYCQAVTRLGAKAPLAVYVSAMMGMIGSRLGETMAKTTAPDGEHTQLWILRFYFKKALIYAIATIVVSSVVLLMPELDREISSQMKIVFYHMFSAIGLGIYAVNLFFMGITLQFILNRQI